MSLSVIITAGGSSSRYGNKNKLLELINGKEVIVHSIEAFLPLNPVEIIVSASESLEAELVGLVSHIKNLKIVRGGLTRQASIFNALKVCDNPDYVAIHDAARPLVLSDDVERCLDKAVECSAAVLAVKAVDTIKKADACGKVLDTPDRKYLWTVQTPQIFDYKLILNAHKKLEGLSFSDDSGMVEALGVPVYLVEGSYSNIKITTKKDLFLAQALLNDAS